MISAIISDGTPVFPGNEPHLSQWVEQCQADTRATAHKVILNDVSTDFFVPWAESRLYDEKALAMRQVDEEMVEYERGLHKEKEAAARDAAAAHELSILAGYWAKAKEHVCHEVADNLTTYQTSYLLSLEVAARDQVNNASMETFTELHRQAIELANLEFDTFKHGLWIQMAEHKDHTAVQLDSQVKAETKLSSKAARKAKHSTPFSVKSTPMSSTPPSPSIPAAVRAAAPSPESLTLQAKSFAPGISDSVESAACDTPPMHPAPEITCAASDVHTVIQNTALAEANTLLHSNSSLMVPVQLDCAPSSNIIEQMPVDTPSQLSTVTVPPSQDFSTLIANLQSSMLASMGAMLQPVVSWLSSLESFSKDHVTVAEAPYSPSHTAVLWRPITSGPMEPS